MSEHHKPKGTPDYALIYDTETSDMIKWGEPSGGENQPHIIQLGAQLVNIHTKEVEAEINHFVAPDGWEIAEGAAAVHGYTTDRAKQVATTDEKSAIASFIALYQANPNTIRVGHSERFDARILRIGLKRFGGIYDPDDWKEEVSDCTGLLSKPIMKMGKRGKYGHKMPKLVEAYEFFTGKEFSAIDQHTAIGDCNATRELYFAILDHLGENKE